MKKMMTRICSLMVAFAASVVTVAAAKTPVLADQIWPEGPSIESPNAVVMEINTGTVLYEKNGHEQRYPASITKVMTSWLALENCSMDEIVVFSADAVFKNEGNTSHIARDLNEELTVEQCLNAVMLASANECAYAIAEHVGKKKGGDYQTFIDMMNERAKEIGCLNTHFNNSNGLPDENHWTSAYDMALIASNAYKNEAFRILVGTKSYTIPVTNKHDEEFPMHNHHQMLYPFRTQEYLYEYCTGGKTGYTDAARSTLVTFAEKDGIALVCVVMKTGNPTHYVDTTTLMDYYLNNFQALSIAENETNIGTEGLENAGLLNTNESFVTLDEDAYVILPKTAVFSDATFELVTNSSGENVASLEYTYGDKVVGRADIVASHATVEQTIKEDIEDKQEKSEEKVLVIKPYYFLILLLTVVILILIFVGIKKLYDNIYVIRHNMEVRHYQKSRFRPIGKKKRARRRRRDKFFR